MDDILYYLWLSQLFCYGSDKPNEILVRYGSPKAFFELSKDELSEIPFLSYTEVNAIKATSLKRAEQILKDCERLNIKIATIADDIYPNRLRIIYGAPIVIYYFGDISGIDDEVAITIVGTRRSNTYTETVTEYLSYELALAGATIVSGCAMGIDARAHNGAIRAKGRTIGVLGCGLDIDYPAKNAKLKRQIASTGALISEMPPGESPNSKIFPIRNRIMAALSVGILVTHAPVRSGSLITVEHGIEQGKDVFCVPPYNIFDQNFMGVCKYLREGAIPVFCASDILFEYYNAYSHKLDITNIINNVVKSTHDKKKEQPTAVMHENKTLNLICLSQEQQAIYSMLSAKPMHIDDIIIALNKTYSEVASLMTELEILGVVISHSGNRYTKIEDQQT